MEGKASAVCNLSICRRKWKIKTHPWSILDEGGVFSFIHFNERSKNFKGALISARIISKILKTLSPFIHSSDQSSVCLSLYVFITNKQQQYLKIDICNIVLFVCLIASHKLFLVGKRHKLLAKVSKELDPRT